MAGQPFLHNLVPTLRVPNQVWADTAGNLDGGAQGIYCYDTRLISRLSLRLTLEGEEVAVEPLTQLDLESGHTRFVNALRIEGDTADPKILLVRDRVVDIEGVREQMAVQNASSKAFVLTLELQVSPDLSSMEKIKSGKPARAVYAKGGKWDDGSAFATWWAPEAKLVESETSFTCCWCLNLKPNSEEACAWSLQMRDESGQFAASRHAGITAQAQRRKEPQEAGGPRAAQEKVDLWTAVAARDLDSLLMGERSRPENSFYAAGAPWFFTLFGRDSIITAWLLRHECPQVGLGTVRALAARQGQADRPQTGEQPGKILHEVRRDGLETFDAGGRISLPPTYFGTIDATPLWVRLFVALWRGGMEGELSPLLQRLQAALEWICTDGDADGDLFLEYVDKSGRGLANQGWKDSGDSIRWADGQFAKAPIALCEAQGYAYAALVEGGKLLGEQGVDSEKYAERAEQIREKFTSTFWVGQGADSYPAIALDAHKQTVTGAASNMGHLLGTGILRADQARAVAERLCQEDLLSPYGIRTLSTSCGAFHPLSYHCGSVWAHDNGMIIDGMLTEGLDEHARTIASRISRAAERFQFRMPELFGVLPGGGPFIPPVPYPASCRPQAWAAATAFVSARALRTRN